MVFSHIPLSESNGFWFSSSAEMMALCEVATSTSFVAYHWFRPETVSGIANEHCR